MFLFSNIMFKVYIDIVYVDANVKLSLEANWKAIYHNKFQIILDLE